MPWFAVAGLAEDRVRLDSSGPDERLRIEARINGRATAVALDTGLDCGYLLFRSDLPQLGLRVPELPAGHSSLPGKYPFILGQPCAWTLLGTTLNDIHPLVLAVPNRFLKEEAGLVGLVGWPAVRKNVWVLDLAEARIGTAKSVPDEAKRWTGFQIKSDLRLLSLQEDSAPGRLPRILVDTGSSDGILLPPGQWRAWRAAHPQARTTISADWMVGQGERAEEQVWADEFVLGDIVVRDVPVQQEDEAYSNMAPGEPVIALGLAALHRLDVVLDGPHGRAYVRASLRPAPPFQHNRLGVEFLSSDARISPQIATRVIAGTPAAEAGIEKGDVLLSVNGKPADKEPYWKKPAGTQYSLTLRRGALILHVDVVLRDLLGPKNSAVAGTGGPGPAYDEVPVALNRDDDEFLLAEGLGMMAGGDYAGAVADFDKAIDLDPDFPQAYCARAECRDYEGDFASASSDLDRAIALNPGYADAYETRAQTRQAERDFAGAVADYDKMIALKPGDPDAFNNRGAAKAGEGMFAAAVSDFDRAIALSPGDAAALFNRGTAKRALGDFAGAIDDFGGAIALNPGDSNAYRARGIARDASGDLTGALADYCNAFPAASRPDLFLRFNISMVLRRLHMDEEDSDLGTAVEAAGPGWDKTIGAYLTGDISESDLIAEARNGGDETLAERECEAYYYAGMVHLLRNETGAARDLFARSLATNASADDAYALARGSLSRLAPAS
jgi:tetratricopeptide (TPR) repeat protein